MQTESTFLYRPMRGLLRLALGFYFSRIVRFHRDRVPRSGPVLFASNHPNSLADPFLIGTSVPRKVNFLATVQLFRSRPCRWLLSHVGVIPVNRARDDPRAMRKVMDTFEACFRVLEKGEAVGIFPEGVTHDDPQLKPVKTGAARMALELEHRHQGKLGLQLVPVGLTFSAKEMYRSEALVNFGEPIRPADYLGAYGAGRHESIQSLSNEIQRRIEALILHVPTLERVRIVRAVRRLYQERVQVGGRVLHRSVPEPVRELQLSRVIARAVDYAFENHPQRARLFVGKLEHYEGWLKRLRLSDEMLVQSRGKGQVLAQSLFWTSVAIAGAPVAAYGWAHRLLPVAVIGLARRLVVRWEGRTTSVGSTSILAGTVAFVAFYALYTAIFHAIFGWPASLYYSLSLPPAGLAAYYYTRELRRFARSLRASWVLLRTPLGTRHLLKLRSELIAEIEAERQLMGPAALKGQKTEA